MIAPVPGISTLSGIALCMSDAVTGENHWRIISGVTPKMLFTVSHTKSYFSFIVLCVDHKNVVAVAM